MTFDRVNYSIENKDIISYVSIIPCSNIRISQILVYIAAFVIVDKLVQNASENSNTKDPSVGIKITSWSL